MIENRNLRYFLVLARTLHMTRAAAQLHIAQPALTQNIQQLEKELGTPLLRRTGHKLSLTDAGRIFQVEAERSLHYFELAKIAAQRAGRGEVGPLVLGFSSTAAIHTVPQLIRNFRRKFPDVELSLRELGSAALLAGLRTGEIDVGVTYARPGKEFPYRELEAEPLVIALPSDHPLAAHKSVALHDLPPTALILPSEDAAPALRESILAECARAGFIPTARQENSTVQAALGLVAAGVGISLLPASARYLMREQVTIRPIRGGIFSVKLLLLWSREDVSPLVRNLLELA